MYLKNTYLRNQLNKLNMHIRQHNDCIHLLFYSWKWPLLIINMHKKFKALPNINEILFNIHLLISFGSAEVELCLTVGPNIDWE